MYGSAQYPCSNLKCPATGISISRFVGRTGRAFVVYVIALVVWIELAERKVPVGFARISASLKAFLGQAPRLSFKLNSAGAVIPVIFATWALSFGSLLAKHGPYWLAPAASTRTTGLFPPLWAAHRFFHFTIRHF
jgi:preprotein translocase subunit SecY